MVWTIVKFFLFILAILEVLFMILAIGRKEIPEEFKYIAILVGMASIVLWLPIHKWVQIAAGAFIALPLILLVLGAILLTMIAGK